MSPGRGDVGTAIGAALELYHRRTQEPTVYEMESMALGRIRENELQQPWSRKGISYPGNAPKTSPIRSPPPR